MSSDATDSLIVSFQDDLARTWEVRAIEHPILSERSGRYMQPEFRGGWLLFTCGREQRRLAPMPAVWHLASPRELRRWCTDAAPVRRPARRSDPAASSEAIESAS